MWAAANAVVSVLAVAVAGCLLVADLLGRVLAVWQERPPSVRWLNAGAVGQGVRSRVGARLSTFFCDSAGARQFVLAHQCGDARNAQMRFVVPDRNLLRALQVIGLDRLLSIYPSLDAAVSAGPAPDRTAASG